MDLDIARKMQAVLWRQRQTHSLFRGIGDKFAAHPKKQPAPRFGKCRLLFEWRMACWDGAHGVALPPYPHCTPPAARGAGNRRNRLTDVLPRVSSAPQNAKAACIYLQAETRNPKPKIQNPKSKTKCRLLSNRRSKAACTSFHLPDAFTAPYSPVRNESLRGCGWPRPPAPLWARAPKFPARSKAHTT